MNLTSSMVAVTLLLASAVAGFSAEKASAKTKASTPAKIAKPKRISPKVRKTEEVALTGSYIKRPVRRDGVVTDGVNPVVVLDNEAIRNSGAADLRQLLIVRGVNH